MSAVVAFAIALVAITIVGTALVAVHDAIAAAIDRRGDASATSPARPASTALVRPRTERFAPLATPGSAIVRVTVRCTDGAAPRGARV